MEKHMKSFKLAALLACMLASQTFGMDFTRKFIGQLLSSNTETKVKAEDFSSTKQNITYLQKQEKLFDTQIDEITRLMRSEVPTDTKKMYSKEYYPAIVSFYNNSKKIVATMKLKKDELSDHQTRIAQALRDFETEDDASKKFLLLPGTLDRAQVYAYQIRARLQTPMALLTELATLEATFNKNKHTQADIRQILVIGEKMKDQFATNENLKEEINALDTLSQEILPRMRTKQEFSLYLKLYIDQIQYIAYSKMGKHLLVSTSSSEPIRFYASKSTSKQEEKKDK